MFTLIFRFMLTFSLSTHTDVQPVYGKDKIKSGFLLARDVRPMPETWNSEQASVMQQLHSAGPSRKDRSSIPCEPFEDELVADRANIRLAACYVQPYQCRLFVATGVAWAAALQLLTPGIQSLVGVSSAAKACSKATYWSSTLLALRIKRFEIHDKLLIMQRWYV